MDHFINIAPKSFTEPRNQIGPASTDLKPRQQRHHHSEEEWNSHKDEIIGFFLHHNYSHDVIVQKLGSTGFPTKVRALKNKLKEWNINKNLKDHDMKVLLDKKNTRTALGKDTVFVHNGVVLTESRLDNYARRASTRNASPLGDDAPTPPFITYHTPTASVMEEWAWQGPEDSGHASKRTRSDAGLNEEPFPADRASKRAKHHTLETFEGMDRVLVEDHHKWEPVLDRLASLANDRKWSKKTAKKNDILQCIQELLDTAQDTQDDSTSKTLKHTATWLRRFRHLFGQQSRITDRSTARKTLGQSWTASRKVSASGVINFRHGQLLFVHSKVCAANSDVENPFKGHRLLQLTFIPSSTNSPGGMCLKGFEATIMSSFSPGAGHSLVSSLEMNNVLPSSSTVFQVVSQGNLREFRSMLSLGSASLRDQDEYGASLLMYATQQPEMLKFLIAAGLDVDHSSYVAGQYIPCLLRDIPRTVLELCTDPDIEDRHTSVLCSRQLLEAGANPLLMARHHKACFSFVELAILNEKGEELQLVWNSQLTGLYYTIKTWRSSGGRPPIQFVLHIHVRFAQEGETLERMAALLELGADPGQRDQRGMTALHAFVAYLHDYLRDQSWFQPAYLTYLKQVVSCLDAFLEFGADPFANDNEGRSISATAYKSNTGWLGDVWDACLTRHGIDIECQRHAVGLARDPKHPAMEGTYDVIWAGIKHLCPYGEKEKWPSDLPTSDQVEWAEENLGYKNCWTGPRSEWCPDCGGPQPEDGTTAMGDLDDFDVEMDDGDKDNGVIVLDDIVPPHLELETDGEADIFDYGHIQ